jgi:hypothetical protein
MHRKRALQMDFREGFYKVIGDTSSSGADEIRHLNKQMLEAAFPDDIEMQEKLTPGYHPGCKRVVISDDYYPTLSLPHVSLCTSGISAITPTGIATDTGETDYDIIICATGFQTLDFMHPISMNGHSGASLKDIWKTGAKALYGVTVSQMPNFAMLYGPNTNLGHNSIILMIEAQASYISALISPILAARKAGKPISIRPKDSRMQEFNETLQNELSNSAFADPNCQSWYKTSSGLITNNWSRNVIDYQKLVATVHWEDFEIEGDGREKLQQKKEVKIGRVREETLVGEGMLKMMGMGSLVAVLAVGWWSRGGGRFMVRV